MKLISAATGRVEKVVEAHAGAILALAWNSEGSAIATAGEDGFVKQWSTTGNLRSKIAQSGTNDLIISWEPFG